MKALVNKELCELLPPAVMVLAIATVFGALDLLYNWRVDHCLGISLSLCIAIAFGVAFIRGADAFARESRDHLSFLATWPLDRGTIWVVKFALSLSLAALTSLLSFAICLVLVRMAGYRDDDLARLLHDPTVSVFVALWFGCYALSFFWSTLLRTPLAAAGLGLATAALLTLGLSYLLIDYVPGHFGPWLGFDPARLDPKPSAALTSFIAVAVALAAFAASALAFVRSPVLEARRRAFRGLGSLLAVIVALLILSAATYWAVDRPSLSQVTDIAMDRAGRHLVLQSTGRAPGVWVADLVDGGKPRLIARSESLVEMDWDGGPLLGVSTGAGDSGLWLVDLQTGSFRHVGRYVLATSPSGRLFCTTSREGVVVEDIGGRTVINPIAAALQVAFSADDRYLYAWRPATGSRAPGEERSKLLLRFDLATGRPAKVADVPGSSGSIDFSPSGRLACTIVTRGTGRAAVQCLVVLDLQTGKQRPFLGLYPTGMQWSGDDRYLWAATRGTRSNPDRQFRLIDTRTMAVVRSLGPREMLAAAGPPMTAAGAAQQSVRVPQPPRNGLIYFSSGPVQSADPQKIIWSAKPDGTGLRLVCRDRRHWLGVAATGELVFWEPTTAGPKITLVDPATHLDRLLF